MHTVIPVHGWRAPSLLEQQRGLRPVPALTELELSVESRQSIIIVQRGRSRDGGIHRVFGGLREREFLEEINPELTPCEVFSK